MKTSKISSTDPCPCGSALSFGDCCAPYIHGDKQAPTAEALMRSRYAAFATVEVPYILATHDARTRHQVTEREIRAWAETSEWKGLQILKADKGAKADSTGSVEFKAQYRQADTDVNHHEIAHFRQVDGKWFFVDGRLVGNGTVQREEPKLGRNDPCHCGSGQKFKKCHGL